MYRSIVSGYLGQATHRVLSGLPTDDLNHYTASITFSGLSEEHVHGYAIAAAPTARGGESGPWAALKSVIADAVRSRAAEGGRLMMPLTDKATVKKTPAAQFLPPRSPTVGLRGLG